MIIIYSYSGIVCCSIALILQNKLCPEILPMSANLKAKLKGLAESKGLFNSMQSVS